MIRQHVPILLTVGTLFALGLGMTTASAEPIAGAFTSRVSLDRVDNGFDLTVGGLRRAHLEAVDATVLASTSTFAWLSTTGAHGGATMSQVDTKSGSITTVLASKPEKREFLFGFGLATVAGKSAVSYLAGHDDGYCSRHELRLADTGGTTLRTVRVADDVDLRSGAFQADGSAIYTAVACVNKAAGQADLTHRVQTVNGTWKTDRTGTVRTRVSDSVDAAANTASPTATVARTKVLPNHYVHQLWDTEANFNGSWACSATSAVMALAGYQITNPWLSHRAPSEYGDYVTQQHPTKSGPAAGYTAPAPSINDPYPYDGVYQNGGPVYWPGVYGWTVDGDGYGHADWIVSYAKAMGAKPHVIANSVAAIQNEIDTGYFVIVGGQYSLPAGGGHFAVVVGYKVYSDGTVTFVVNDPYGYHQTGADNGAAVEYTLDQMRATRLIAT